MRKRSVSSRHAGRSKKRVAEPEAVTASPKRSYPPLVERFYVVVDRQLKSGHQTYEDAENAARSIKKRYPLLQVTVYDAEEQRHIPIEGSKSAAPGEKSPHSETSMSPQNGPPLQRRVDRRAGRKSSN